jgi:hypothetical protein
MVKKINQSCGKFKDWQHALLVPDLFQSLKTEPEDFVHFFDKKNFLHDVVLRVKSNVLDPDMNPEPALNLIRVLLTKT